MKRRRSPRKRIQNRFVVPGEGHTTRTLRLLEINEADRVTEEAAVAPGIGEFDLEIENQFVVTQVELGNLPHRHVAIVPEAAIKDHQFDEIVQFPEIEIESRHQDVNEVDLTDDLQGEIARGAKIRDLLLEGVDPCRKIATENRVQ